MLTNLEHSKPFHFPRPAEAMQSLAVSDSARQAHLYPTSKQGYLTALHQDGLVKLFLAEMQELI